MPLTPEQVEDIAVAAATRAAKLSVEDAAKRAAETVAMSHSELNDVVAEAVKQTLSSSGWTRPTRLRCNGTSNTSGSGASPGRT